MDPIEYQRRKDYLDLTPADGDNVRQLREVFHRHAQTFAERFYDHLQASPLTAPFLQDPVVLERLKRLQAEYFAQLLEGVFDDEYVQSRHRVGRAHQRVGIEPLTYLGAYNQYIQLTFPLFVEAFGDRLAEVLPALLSLVKVIFFDITLALDTYFRDATERLRRQNEDLRQALVLVQQARQREEQLRRLLGHEIRGGLAAIITSLEDLLDRTDLDEEPRDDLEHVHRRAWSMTEMLTEMLTQGAEPHPGGPSRVDVRALLQSLRSRFDLYTVGRDVELTLPASPPSVWADPLQLREVFANLLANAVRYLDKPQGRIEVIARPFAPGDAPADLAHPDGTFILFGVRDNGPGLPDSIRARLFEPFVRGPDTGNAPPGTGLGLYFVRTSVEQGGGRIWFESQRGTGTCFWFTFPAGASDG